MNDTEMTEDEIEMLFMALAAGPQKFQNVVRLIALERRMRTLEASR